MSHHATNWAIRVKGLKPATKIVLWHLADRHHPDNGCFPRQKTLAEDCEMSRSALNEHLVKLESLGLIQRERSRDPDTKQQRPTRYNLAIDGPFPVSGNETRDTTSSSAVSGNETRAVSEIRTIAVSGKSQKPCPENGDSRVRIPDSNSVREPVREPVKDVVVVSRGASDAESFFSRVLDVVGINRNDIPSARWMPPAAEIEVNRWPKAFGVTEDQALECVAHERKRHTETPSGPKAFEHALRRLGAVLAAPPLAAPASPAPISRYPPDRPHRVLTDDEMRAAMRRSRKEA